MTKLLDNLILLDNFVMHSITTVSRTVFIRFIVSQNFTDLCEINCGFPPISEGHALITTG